jgi:Protein of unknown function (DUF2911)
MKMLRRNILVFTLSATAAASCLLAQGGKPSAPGTAQIDLKGKSVSITYSRPKMRGRKIMGGLVPYGEVWRTGANEATSLKSAVDLNIGGADLPAGSYTLYTLPAQQGSWKLIINKQTGQWGTEYDQSQDFARVDLPQSKLDATVEEFTIKFVKTVANSADLVLEWENTKLSVPVRAR